MIIMFIVFQDLLEDSQHFQLIHAHKCINSGFRKVRFSWAGP